MILKTLILDDEAKSRNLLNNLLIEYCPEVKVVGMAQNLDQAFELYLKYSPQLVFLDVELPNGTGFDFIKRLSNIDLEVVFVTGFDQYALQAIKTHALDYLLKPLDVDELIKAVKRAEQAIRNQHQQERLKELIFNLSHSDTSTHKIAIPSMNGRELVTIEQIMYCQAEGGYTWIHLASNQKILSCRNLGEYERILPGKMGAHKHGFYRAHHSHLINLFYVDRYNSRDNFVQMQNGTKLGIAQRRKSAFLQLIDSIGRRASFL